MLPTRRGEVPFVTSRRVGHGFGLHVSIILSLACSDIYSSDCSVSLRMLVVRERNWREGNIQLSQHTFCKRFLLSVT